MTNVRGSALRVNRPTVIQDVELTDALSKAQLLPSEFFRLRAKATLSIARLSGKRRGELAMLPKKNVKVVGTDLHVDWILEKKRTEIMLNKTVHKMYPLSDPLTQHVINWIMYLDDAYPNCEYFLPSAKDCFGTYVVYLDRHVTPKTVFNIMRACSESIWPHLNRETFAADIIAKDNTIAAIYAVQEELDLDPYRGFETASRYTRRFGRHRVIRQPQSSPS
jgi:hypothetical protein